MNGSAIMERASAVICAAMAYLIAPTIYPTNATAVSLNRIYFTSIWNWM